MSECFRFTLENTINKNRVADYDRHADQGDNAHPFQGSNTKL